MRIEPYIIFEDKHWEIEPLEAAFNAHRILERHLDLLQGIEPEMTTRFIETNASDDHQVLNLMEVTSKMMHSVSRMSEVSPKRLRKATAALLALRTACEREKTWDYGPEAFGKVIIEARNEQIRLIDEALNILKIAEDSISKIEIETTDQGRILVGN